MPHLNSLKVAAVGVSPDPVQTQKKFDDKYGLEFPLLSDTDHVVADRYGVGRKRRSTEKSRGESFAPVFSSMKAGRSSVRGTR